LLTNDDVYVTVVMFQNDKMSSGVMPGSNVEAAIVNADDGMKVPSVAQLLDVSSDSGCQNELTVTNEMSASRPTIVDADRSNVLSPKPPEQSAANQSTVESGASGQSSQESTVTRTRSRDVMDFAHLKMKLVQLTGTSKEAAGPGTVAAKTKPDTEETKDMSVDVAPTNSTSQLGVGRPVVGQPVVSGNQAVELQPVAHRGPSLSPEPGTAPAQAASQQASMPELPATSTVQRDASIQPAIPAPTVGQTKAVPSNGEHAAAPVQPVKPVPVYPASVDQSLPQQKLAGGQMNGSNAFQHVPASMLAPDIQSAMLLQQYQMASAMPGLVDGTSGFAPVQPGVVGDMVTTSSPASPDGINQAIAPQQPAAADYSPVSLLSLYNQMMMPLSLMAPGWPALGLNPYLVAANPLLAAQLLYGAPVMPPVSESVGQMPAADPHIGIQSYPVAGQELQQPVMPPGVGLDHAQRDQAVRTMTGLAPMASAGMTSAMLPTRPVVPRFPAAHEQQPAMHATSVPRKRPDRPPHLANLEQALSRLHGPRKAAAPMIPVHSPAVHSLPGSMAWFPVHYGQQAQPTYTMAAVQSPVVSPLLSTDLQQPGTTTFNLATDMTTSVGASTAVSSTSLAVTSTYSGRTTPSVATTAESVPVTVKSVTPVTLSSANKVSEPAETVHATASAAEKLALTSASSTEELPSKRKLQFTVSAVKDDPLTVSDVQESVTVCEASIVSSESASQNPPQNLTSTQNYASVPSGLQEPVPGSTGKAPVKKGRFRISDVREDADGGVSSSQLEDSSLTNEASLASGTMTDPSNQCTAAAVLTAPDQQVCAVNKCFYFSALLQSAYGSHLTIHRTVGLMD